MTIKEILYNISTCGPLGAMHGGGLIASLLAIPLVLVCQLLNWISPNIHLVLHGLALTIAILAMYATLRMIGEQDSSVIVLDKVIGLSIAYCCIPLSIKLYVIGFLLFHLGNVLFPWIVAKTWDVHINKYPHIFGILASDLLAGIAVQFILRIVAWLAH